MITKKLAADTTEVLFHIGNKKAVAAQNDFKGDLLLKFYSVSVRQESVKTVSASGNITSKITTVDNSKVNYLFKRAIHSSEMLSEADEIILDMIKPLYNEVIGKLESKAS